MYSERNLRAGYEKVTINDGAAGVDHITAEEFGRDLDNNLRKLAEELRLDLFCPQAIRRVRDRIVQAALVHVIMPIFEVEFAERSYGFRPHRGCKDALLLPLFVECRCRDVVVCRERGLRMVTHQHKIVPTK